MLRTKFPLGDLVNVGPPAFSPLGTSSVPHSPPLLRVCRCVLAPLGLLPSFRKILYLKFCHIKSSRLPLHTNWVPGPAPRALHFFFKWYWSMNAGPWLARQVFYH
jgi:hypothetical protein